MYSVPPEGARVVTMLVCPNDPDCAAEADWVNDARPDDIVVGVDSLLALNVMQGGDSVSRSETFAASLDTALVAIKAESWTDATKRLDEAQRALAGWTGAPTNQQLFNLYYLRAVVKLAQSKQAGEAFQQAAAVAWNRSVALPYDAEPYSSMYYTAVYHLLTEGLGTVELQPVPDTSYTLDGVELGEGPIQLSVFAGLHRLNATRRGTSDAWRTSLKVQAFRTSNATARPESSDDLGWLATGMVQAVEEHTLDGEITTLLRDWCEHYALAEVHILVAEPAVDPFADPTAQNPEAAFGLRGVTYDPKLRRFTGE
jgi:hypothetical protein